MYTFKKKCSKSIAELTENIGIKTGMTFDEKSVGTNAIALSVRLIKAFYTIPIHHYCDFLKKFYIYSVPIGIKSEFLGNISVCVQEGPISIELGTIVDLAAYRITNEYNRKMVRERVKASDIKLNKKQLDILKLIAKGYPDKIIASEECITLNTVKYHKKLIFKTLGVESSIQAVIKSLKESIITFDELNY